MKSKLRDNLWKHIFEILSVILWIIVIVLYFKRAGGYRSDDYRTQMEIMTATRWYPACFIGAIISTAAAYFLSALLDYIDKRGK